MLGLLAAGRISRPQDWRKVYPGVVEEKVELLINGHPAWSYITVCTEPGAVVVTVAVGAFAI